MEGGRGADEIDPLGIGEVIDGRYRLVRPLGAGGAATVWEVEHRELGRRFALKVCRQRSPLTDVVAARFLREARLAASMDHPNVVRVVDHRVDAVVGPFIVMELLAGQPLSASMEPGVAFSLRNTVKWLSPVADALDAIHGRGLVHRDVKPENVVRVPDPETVKLVDFGLAMHVDGHDRVTKPGTLLGTPHYMAPECVEGLPVTPSSDVYSLAVVAFELLTGELPHDGDTPMDVMCAKLTTPAPSLAERTGRMFAIPIEEAFHAALDPEPLARPRRASAFVARLASCLRD